MANISRMSLKNKEEERKMRKGKRKEEEVTGKLIEKKEGDKVIEEREK